MGKGKCWGSYSWRVAGFPDCTAVPNTFGSLPGSPHEAWLKLLFEARHLAINFNT